MGQIFNSRKHNRRHDNNKHNKRVNCKPLALAIAVAITGTLPNMAKALEYQVTSTADSGEGSLRQAILEANATIDTPDTIVFDTSAVPAGSTITLSSPLSITDDLIITGPTDGDAGSIILDGDEQNQLINSYFSSPPRTKTITLENITLQNGSYDGTSQPNNNGGGAIYVRRANLTINHGLITSNKTNGINDNGGGIYLVGGNLNLNSSTVSNNQTYGTSANGGGVSVSYGFATISKSTISANTSAKTGGGLYVKAGNASIFESTISGNKSATKGGGLYTVFGDTLIRQSTISGNASTSSDGGGGLFTFGGKTTIQNSTITNNTAASNGAGVSVDLSSGANYVVLSNTILSGNTNSANDTADNFHDRSSSPVGVLIATYSVLGEDISNGNFSNNFVSNAPDIGPLQDNGGPTFNHLPVRTNTLLGGNVVDKGNNTGAPSEDQRGTSFNRIIGSVVDIGAVELQTTDPSIVTNNDDSGPGSLRQAILYANNSSSLDSIDLSAVSNQTITLKSELKVTDTITISGPTEGDATSIILDGDARTRIINATGFEEDSGDTITLENITLQNGKYSSTGTFSNEQGGAAIAVKNADLVLNNTHINNNETTGPSDSGGAISVRRGNADITNSTITGNLTKGFVAMGGGINLRGELILNNSTISGNSTTGRLADGGGLYVRGNIILNQSTVSGNSTTGESADGGGFDTSGNAILNQSTVSGNSTTGESADGGGVYVQDGNITLNQSTVSGNSTTGSSARGGGVHVKNGNVSLNQSTIAHNTANAAGAGIFFFGYAYGETKTFNLNLNNTVLSNNRRNQSASNLSLDLTEIDSVNNGDTGNIILNTNFQHSLLGTDVISSINSNLDAYLPTNTATIENDNPGLGPLQNNGGITFTHAPISGSPVIDKGNNDLATDFTEDQRGTGFDRIINETVDIGAVELQTIEPSFSYDIDGNGQVAALSDGLLVLRYLFGFREGALIAGAIGNSASRTTATEIQTYIQQGVTSGALDIDGNGEVTALTDGLLLLRYQFGFSGTSLIQGAVGNNAVRDTADAIESFLN